MEKIHERFRGFSRSVSNGAANVWTFIVAIAIVLIWAITGPFFDFSTTWQIIINTATTIITFLMIFLMHNASTREAKTTQLKLDELIRAVADARNHFVDLDRIPDSELKKLEIDIKTNALKSDKEKGIESKIIVDANE